MKAVNPTLVLTKQTDQERRVSVDFQMDSGAVCLWCERTTGLSDFIMISKAELL